MTEPQTENKTESPPPPPSQDFSEYKNIFTYGA